MEGGGVIDYITFNEELNAINDKLLHSKDPKVKEARLMIIGTMQKYEKRVSEFEKEYAPKAIDKSINGMIESVSA